MRITFHGHRPDCLRASAVHVPQPPTNRAAPAVVAGQSVREINLGFFKMKIHRQTALQTSLLETLANRSDVADPQAAPVGLASRSNSEAAFDVHSMDSSEPPFNPPDAQNQAASARQRSMRSGSASVQTEATATAVPRTRDEYVAHWNAWAQAGGPEGGGRPEAVRRMTDWLDRHPSRLDLSLLELDSLPDHLPEGVQNLDVGHNRLTDFPPNLLSGLRRLCLGDNRLTRLPEPLPEGLESLDAPFNLLTHLPERFPSSLQTLDLGFNELVSLPETFPSQMGPNSMVDLLYNPLSNRARDGLRTLTSAPDYAGPQIHFWMAQSGSGTAPTRPLHEAVAAWPGQTRADAQATASLWQSFADEPGAADFSRFLDRLRATVNFDNPQFQRSVSDWLTHLETHPTLRQDTFMVSQGATTSCEDRVSLTFNAMRQLRLSSDVARGDYDQRLPELLTLARGMFRLDQLETIAREKTASLKFVDEIEVYLAYQVKLRESLSLPLETPDMRYFDVSYVSEQDLTRAQERVNTAEREGFTHYLASDWQPWQSVMRRLNPEGHARAQDELMAAMGEDFSARLEARLQGLGLEADPDAQRLVGAQVRTEITHEINGRLTRDFLSREGLLTHIEPR